MRRLIYLGEKQATGMGGSFLTVLVYRFKLTRPRYGKEMMDPATGMLVAAAQPQRAGAGRRTGGSDSPAQEQADRRRGLGPAQGREERNRRREEVVGVSYKTMIRKVNGGRV